MAVAPVLAHQRQCVPQGHVGLVGPGPRGVAGEERPAHGLAPGGRGAGQGQGLGQLRAGRHVVAQDPPQHPVDDAEPGGEQVGRGRAGPGLGDRPPDQRRREVVEGGDHDLGRHRAHGRRTRGEGAHPPRQAERRVLVLGLGLGHEVDEPVEGLDRAVHLAGDGRLHVRPPGGAARGGCGRRAGCRSCAGRRPRRCRAASRRRWRRACRPTGSRRRRPGHRRAARPSWGR